MCFRDILSHFFILRRLNAAIPYFDIQYFLREHNSLFRVLMSIQSNKKSVWFRLVRVKVTLSIQRRQYVQNPFFNGLEIHPHDVAVSDL